MGRIFDVKVPTDRRLFYRRKVLHKARVHHPIPDPTEDDPERGTGEDLSDGVVTQIDPGVHGKDGERPRDKSDDDLPAGNPEPSDRSGGCGPDAADPKEGEVDSEEEHVLGVAGGPAMGVTGLERGAGVGARLLNGFLDELVEELGNGEAEGKENGLELAAENEVGQEAAEADEDGDERDPGKEKPQCIPSLVADVR